MERNKIISLALSFVSFLIARASIKNVILFGSIASDKYDKESDIDLFIEGSEDEIKIKKFLELYTKTVEYAKFQLEGITHEISIKVGNLDKWENVKRNVISNGIILYGRYKDQPKNLHQNVLFILNLKRISRAKKIKVWRKLYGYKQKVGKKVYIKEGLVVQYKGKKLARGIFIIPSAHASKVIIYLKKINFKYKIMPFWQEDSV